MNVIFEEKIIHMQAVKKAVDSVNLTEVDKEWIIGFNWSVSRKIEKVSRSNIALPKIFGWDFGKGM